MRRFAVLVFLLLSSLLPNLAAQQPPPVAPSESAKSPEQQKAPKTEDDKTSKPDSDQKDKKDYSQEGLVIEQVRTLYRFEFDGTGRKESMARVRAQSEAGVARSGQRARGYTSADEPVEMPYVRVR